MLTTIITSAFTAVVTAVVTGLILFAVQERRLRAELRTEFMAEQAARILLTKERWEKRTFAEIQKRLGGFTDDDLRKILVRAGAVRFIADDGSELWGLISRNEAHV